jgi:membrane protein required for beta-lactamase induction
MTPQETLVGWGVALGFILTVLVVSLLAAGVGNGSVKSPLAPFIRAFERRQAHRHKMAELRLRAKIVRSGSDPEYIRFLQDKVHDDMKEEGEES